MEKPAQKEFTLAEKLNLTAYAVRNMANTSKAHLGQCKNCTNPRRHGSSYCQKCSDKHSRKA